MHAECLRRQPGASWGAAATAAVAAIVLIASAVPAAAATRALDCNSDLDIGLPSMTAMPGDMLQVTLTVQNGLSTDAFNNNVAQKFDTISFFPSCTTTLPCVSIPTLPVSFVGLVSNTCGVMPTATPMAGGTQIDFTFSPNPPALTLPAAILPATTTSCNIVFTVQVDAALSPMSLPQTIGMEARTMGVCDPTGLMLNSSAEGTANVQINPPPFCGDGNLDPGEACDDGNNVDGDGCSATCTIEPRCGDGNLDPGEMCDDGNNVDGDGCSATCEMEAPTLGQYGLLALALLLALGSWATLRRRVAG